MTDCLEDMFSGRAADQWHMVIRETKRTATTSGIGHNSMMYSSIRDILLAYPAHGVKADLVQRKAVDLGLVAKQDSRENPLVCHGVLRGLRQGCGSNTGQH